MEIKQELDDFLKKVQSELSLPHLYQMDIHRYDDNGRIDELIIICWRQWVEDNKKPDSIILRSERQWVEFTPASLFQAKFPADIAAFAIRKKVENYPEPLKGLDVDWGQINKSACSMIQLPNIGVKE